jgi:hypothetical protein
VRRQVTAGFLLAAPLGDLVGRTMGGGLRAHTSSPIRGRPLGITQEQAVRRRVRLLAMTAAELRARAIQEAAELGSEPVDLARRRLWREARRSAVLLLSFLADRDASLLRRAALEAAGEWVDPVARNLLLDAADTCRGN